MCNNLLLSRLFGKIRTREKTKPTSFLREYTSSAFCHIIRLSLKQSYMTKTNVPLYSVRRQQLRDRIPVGIHLNVIRGTWPRIKKSQITCDHKSHVITNHMWSQITCDHKSQSQNPQSRLRSNWNRSFSHGGKGDVTKNQQITMLVLLSESLCI